MYNNKQYNNLMQTFDYKILNVKYGNAILHEFAIWKMMYTLFLIMNEQVNIVNQRLLSLDVMRGLIMILLAGESCLVYESLRQLALPSFLNTIVEQFFHHPWHGFHFWDLVQPAFMLMAGSAMYIAYHLKKEKGITWQQNFKHISVRCLKLFICGTALHCVYAGKLVWELWNVLTQLSITTLIAYLIIHKSNRFQIIVSICLLLLTEILYRTVLMPGFIEPFVTGKNFGNWMDMVLMGKINSDGWVAINIIPTAAHTIWGVLAGKLLVSNKTAKQKIITLLIAGIIGLIVGYGLDVANITPIIKRISTSSFAFVSGGWVLIILAFLYWLVDVKQYKKYAWIAVLVGMNAIFIYLFFETVGVQWFNGVIGIFVKGFLGFTGVGEKGLALLSACVTLLLEWFLCYWFYKKKIFIKL
jgi:predicted acyltransferase